MTVFTTTGTTIGTTTTTVNQNEGNKLEDSITLIGKSALNLFHFFCSK